jgi:hypothetical protein
MDRTEWWTIWAGRLLFFCSRHISYDAAKRAARACEKRGGAPHEIIQVTYCDYEPRISTR